jgi:hypothetical protein
LRLRDFLFLFVLVYSEANVLWEAGIIIRNAVLKLVACIVRQAVVGVRLTLLFIIQCAGICCGHLTTKGGRRQLIHKLVQRPKLAAVLFIIVCLVLAVRADFCDNQGIIWSYDLFLQSPGQSRW